MSINLERGQSLSGEVALMVVMVVNSRLSTSSSLSYEWDFSNQSSATPGPA